MCDAMSMVSAYSSYTMGKAQSIDLKSQGDFAMGMARAQGIQLQADAKGELAVLTKDFTENMRRNTAAMAVTGLNPGSFDQIMKGNMADLRENAAMLDSDADRAQADALAQGQMEKMFKRIEAKAAMNNGILDAFSALQDAESAYQDSRLHFLSCVRFHGLPVAASSRRHKGAGLCQF